MLKLPVLTFLAAAVATVAPQRWPKYWLWHILFMSSARYIYMKLATVICAKSAPDLLSSVTSVERCQGQKWSSVSISDVFQMIKTVRHEAVSSFTYLLHAMVSQEAHWCIVMMITHCPWCCNSNNPPPPSNALYFPHFSTYGYLPSLQSADLGRSSQTSLVPSHWVAAGSAVINTYKNITL